MTDTIACGGNPVLYLSQLLDQPVLDTQGGRIGTVRDLMIQFGSASHPPVCGIVASHARREVFLDSQQVAEVSRQGVRLATFSLNLRPFERRSGEALLRHDILDKQLIDIDGRRLVRANDLLLACVEGELRLVAVDVSIQGLLRRLGPAALTGNLVSHRLIDWADVESFATDVPMVRLRLAHEGLSKLHPVDIAHIIDQLSPRQGREVLESLTDETAADAVQELAPEEAADLLEGLHRERAADILDEMEPNDAADVLAEMPAEQAADLLDRMEPDEAIDVRALLTYPEDTAAGLMTTEFITMPEQLTVAEVLERLRVLPEPPTSLHALYLVPVPDSRQLSGVVPLRNLVFAGPRMTLAQLAQPGYPTVHPEEPARNVASTMAEYHLTDLPVVDEEGRILGVVVVDDAIEVILPERARRASGEQPFRS